MNGLYTHKPMSDNSGCERIKECDCCSYEYRSQTTHCYEQGTCKRCGSSVDTKKVDKIQPDKIAALERNLVERVHQLFESLRRELSRAT